MSIVGPTLTMHHSSTDRVKVRKVISFQSSTKVGAVCVCVGMCERETMQSERKADKRGGFNFQKPLGSVYCPASSFENVLT